MNVIEKLKSIQNKEMTAKENVENFIKVIDEKNEELNIFLEVNKESALKQAEAIDEKIANGEKVGFLSGLVFGIKANINVEDYIISAASKTLDNYFGSYNATVIDKILFSVLLIWTSLQLEVQLKLPVLDLLKTQQLLEESLEDLVEEVLLQ